MFTSDGGRGGHTLLQRKRVYHTFEAELSANDSGVLDGEEQVTDRAPDLFSREAHLDGTAVTVGAVDQPHRDQVFTCWRGGEEEREE